MATGPSHTREENPLGSPKAYRMLLQGLLALLVGIAEWFCLGWWERNTRQGHAIKAAACAFVLTSIWTLIVSAVARGEWVVIVSYVAGTSIGAYIAARINRHPEA